MVEEKEKRAAQNAHQNLRRIASRRQRSEEDHFRGQVLVQEMRQQRLCLRATL